MLKKVGYPVSVLKNNEGKGAGPKGRNQSEAESAHLLLHAHSKATHSSPDVESAGNPSVDKWVKNLCGQHSNIYNSEVKHLPCAITWMELEDVVVSERSKAQKGTLHVLTPRQKCWSREDRAE